MMRIFFIMKEYHNYLLKLILLVTTSSLIALYINYFVIYTRSCSAVSSPSLAKMDEDNIEQMEMEQFSKLVVSPKYKIAFCPIPKVLSSILFEAICYLENEEKFKNTKDINHGWYYFGLCTKEGRLTYLTGKAAKEFMDGERGGKDYLKIAIVRNPVDRFLSGYSNKCLRVIDGKLHKGRDCYECNNNMKCILETLHLRSKLYLNGSLNGYIEPKNEVPQIDLHLLPQSWSCDFAHHLNDYKIIKYQTEDSSNVLNELFEIFRSRNVSEKLLEGSSQVFYEMKEMNKLGIHNVMHIVFSATPNDGVSSREKNEKIHLPIGLSRLLEQPGLEKIQINRLIGFEKEAIFPSIQILSFTTELFHPKFHHLQAINCSHNEQSGMFECVQSAGNIIDEKTTLENTGYILFAYQTLEHMYTKDFSQNWKTWTGARASFHREMSGNTHFAYVMIIEIPKMMTHPNPILNALHCLRPKICAFSGVYKQGNFIVDYGLCKSLGLSEDDSLNAFASEMIARYSNHTVYVEFPGSVEYRNDETMETIDKSNAETQTESRSEYCPKVRRTLPKLLIETSSDKGINIDDNGNPISSSTFIPSKDILIKAKVENSNSIVKIGEYYLMLLDNDRKLAPSDKKPDFEKKLEKPKELQLMENHTRSQQNKEKDEEVEGVMQNSRNESENEDLLLKRLKQRYFNSPEYTAKELIEHRKAMSIQHYKIGHSQNLTLD
ncbi:hypothetical protein WR25_26468 [Diploscapter pachys]|uniref:DUF7153 domain-containing protein n=1 Tax=Diploscapter pachys TaxID=2018661 RepID=A0A2A2JDS8_9BILA|nr:hypothetical protein WR25_26468 [Diploscapter pachys]